MITLVVLLIVAAFAAIVFRVLLNGSRSAKRPVPVRVRSERRHMQNGP